MLETINFKCEFASIISRNASIGNKGKWIIFWRSSTFEKCLTYLKQSAFSNEYEKASIFSEIKLERQWATENFKVKFFISL